MINSVNTWQPSLIIDGNNSLVEAGKFEITALEEPGQINQLRLIVTSDHVQLWINGMDIANLDMSGLADAGKVMVAM